MDEQAERLNKFEDAVEEALRRFGRGVVPDKSKDGWIKYHGHGCPVDNEEVIEVELFDGVKSKGSASSFCWWNLAYGSALDGIKYYRIILGDEVDMSVEEKVDLGLRPGEVLRMPNYPEEKNVNEWIDYINGTGCPVNEDAMVEVVMNSGGIARDFAGVFIWGTNGLGGIKKFRIILDEKNVGKKYDGGKVRFSLVPQKALTEVMDVLEFGAKKYGDENWKMVDNLQRRYFDAAHRHMIKDFKGVLIDEESGSAHLAHAICCLMFKLEDKLTVKHKTSDNSKDHS